jgi:hypothetical protein
MTQTTDTERGDERAQARRDAIALTFSGPLVTGILIAVWAALGSGYFWPMWPMLGMSIAVLVSLYRAFGPLPAGSDAIDSHAPQP